MKNYNIYLLLLMVALIITGCEKDEIELFDADSPGLMFPGAGDGAIHKGYNSGDKTYYVNESFLTVPLEDETYTVDFPVRISGLPLENDVKINYRVIDEETTANSSQYEITEAILPANENYGYIRFVLKRDEALDSLSVNVAIELLDSDEIKVGSNEYKRGILNWSNMLPMFPLTASYTRTFNCVILSPLASKIATQINYYSPNAHRAILYAMDWEVDYFPTFNNGREDPNTGTSTMMGAYYSDYYARRLQKYLDDYAEANGGERLRHNAGDAKGVAIQARVDGVKYDPNL